MGDLDPDVNGKMQTNWLKKLGLLKGDKIEYVYDFGDDIQHLITLENIAEPTKDVKYPRITHKNRSKQSNSEKKGKKSINTLDLYVSSNEEHNRFFKISKPVISKMIVLLKVIQHVADEILNKNKMETSFRKRFIS